MAESGFEPRSFAPRVHVFKHRARLLPPVLFLKISREEKDYDQDGIHHPESPNLPLDLDEVSLALMSTSFIFLFCECFLRFPYSSIDAKTLYIPTNEH